MRRRVLAGAMILTASLAVGGCEFSCSIGTSNEVDAESVEKTITSSLVEDYGEAPRRLDCPDGIEVSEGTEFNCEGTDPAGESFTIRVVLTDDEGAYRFGNPEYEPGPGPGGDPS